MQRSALLCLFVLAASPIGAESWPERKCAIFAEAWQAAAPKEGPAAPSPDFRAGVVSFIASGCQTPRDNCPAGPADVAIADALALIVVLEGMPTTFLPFSCEPPASP